METWPPAGHQLLFGDVPLVPFKSLPEGVVTPGYMQQLRKGDLLTPSSAQPEKDAKLLLQSFLPRVFRRPVSDDDAAPYLGIVREHLQHAERHRPDEQIEFDRSLSRHECSPKAAASTRSDWGHHTA